jgi:hypothetical protein
LGVLKPAWYLGNFRKEFCLFLSLRLSMAKSFELGLGASFLRDICLSGMLYCEKAGVALRFDELLIKEVLAVVAAVSDLFFGGLGVSVILLSVVCD